MSHHSPLPFPKCVSVFLASNPVDTIMFCKRFTVHGLWEINPGAVLDFTSAWPGLVEICKKLYLEDENWFVGDTTVFKEHQDTT